MNKAGDLIGKLLNVRLGEWPRLLLLYGMSLVALIGLTWGDAIVQAAFLQRVGVQYLPWIFIGSAACSILGVFIYSAFADRVSNTRLLLGLLIISGIGIVVCLALLAIGWFVAAYVLLYLVLNVPLLDLYNVHWATYVNGFYDIRAAKRIVPVLGTAECLSGIIAGLSMPLMNRLLSPPSIIVVMLLMLAVMAVLAALMPRLLREKPEEPPKAKAAAKEQNRFKLFIRAYGANLREGYQHIMHSHFLRWMALSTFSMTMLLVFINYGASAIFLEKLKTTVAISDYIGVLSGVANLVVLPIQLFLLSRLIARLGLGNASLIYPATTLAAVGGLAFIPALGTAGLAYLDRTSLRNAFRLPTDNLLYNAVPQRVKARTRAFIGGLLIPCGTILGGLLLLTPLIHATWFLSVGMIVLALTFAASAWMVRRHYGSALVDLLEQEDYSSLALQPSSRQTPSSLSTDPAVLALLSQKLTVSAAPERIVFIAQLITAVCGDAGLPVIRKAALDTDDSRLRASLVDVLAAADIRSPAARDFFAELLNDHAPLVRLSAITGLEQVEGAHDARYLEISSGLLSDPSVEIRLRMLPVLLSSKDEGSRSRASSELRALLNITDVHTRAQAVTIIGQAHAFSFLMELVRSLTDPEDEVRLAAALTTEALAGDESQLGKRDMLLVLALLLLHDPIERARAAAVTVLDRLSRQGGPCAAAASESLVSVLADPSAEIRDRAVDTLVRIGQRIVPALREQLALPEPYLHKMASVALARIEPTKYGSYILGELLEQNLIAIYKNLSCIRVFSTYSSPAVCILERALAEQNTTLTEELFYLMSAACSSTAVTSISKSLRSQHLEERANAAEALESLISPKTAALIAPLVDTELSAQPPLTLASHTWNIDCQTPAAAIRMLLTDMHNAWSRTLAAAALSELKQSGCHVSEAEAAELIQLAQTDTDANVRAEASSTALFSIDNITAVEIDEDYPTVKTLSLVEKLIFIKKVRFFESLTIDQLRNLAEASEVERYPAETSIYKAGDLGGELYIVINGSIGIDQEKNQGESTRLTTVEAGGTCGEADFLNGNIRTSSAITLTDTLTLRLRREPVVALARKNPDIAIKLITALGAQLREATAHIADLTKTHPHIMHRLYDQLRELN